MAYVVGGFPGNVFWSWRLRKRDVVLREAVKDLPVSLEVGAESLYVL